MATPSLSELLSLPADKRADLAIALWESLSDSGRDHALPVNPELAAELDRRWADHLAHPETGVPWEQVLKKLRA
ncbi:MAG: addiction module protein [Acidobacteria bacterium]|nr:addiction module protein [Acidobacteriota bacterium]